MVYLGGNLRRELNFLLSLVNVEVFLFLESVEYLLRGLREAQGRTPSQCRGSHCSAVLHVGSPLSMSLSLIDAYNPVHKNLVPKPRMNN